MTFAIVYTSRTGNTRILAQQVRELLGEDNNVKRMPDNYEKALSHPDETDLKKLEEDVKKIWRA